MQTFVLWFIAILAVLLTALVMVWALFEMLRKTPERKEYFAALVGLLGTIIGTMLGAAVQELRVQDKEGNAEEARAVAAEASQVAQTLQTQMDTVREVLARAPLTQLSARDASALRTVTGQPRLRVPVVPQTWRPVVRPELRPR